MGVVANIATPISHVLYMDSKGRRLTVSLVKELTSEEDVGRIGRLFASKRKLKHVDDLR